MHRYPANGIDASEIIMVFSDKNLLIKFDFAPKKLLGILFIFQTKIIKSHRNRELTGHYTTNVQEMQVLLVL